MEKNKNEESPKVKGAEKRITWVIIVILVVGMLLGVAGTICVYKFTDLGDTKDTTTEKDNTKEDSKKDEDKKDEDKKDDDKPQEPTKKEERELTKSEQEALMSSIDKLQFVDFYNKNIDTPKDYNNQELMWIALGMMGQYGESIDAKSITDKLNKNLYEHDLEMEDLYDWVCDTPYYKYNSNTNVLSYNEEHTGHGGGRFAANVINRFAEGKVNGDEYVITVYKMFSELLELGVSSKYYATYSDAKAQKNAIYDVGDIGDMYEDLTESEQKKILADLSEDKLVKHTYVFVKKGNDFQLKSYKIG